MEVVEKSFVRSGKVATAAGCLAAQDLCGWIIEELRGAEERGRVHTSIQPIGQGLSFVREEEELKVATG